MHLDSLDVKLIRTLHGKLLAWFRLNKRNLPWRDGRDPYRIWVSEVMLQQTTVAAVIPFFERFMKAFPDVRALAQADEQDVLKLWEGLGYYRRARHLHAAAKDLVTQYGGRLPDDPDIWIALPGVGRYILGAVLSQAFDRRLPIVEANTLRVLARLFGYRGDPREGQGKLWVWSAAEKVLPTRNVGDFNQALMELGALICTPTSPHCQRCPVAGQCISNRHGLQKLIPPPPRQRSVTAVSEVGIVIRDERRLLLCQRSAGASRWQNMWEIPHAERTPMEKSMAAAKRIARELTGLSVAPEEEMLTINHSVTRFAISLTCIAARRTRGEFVPGFYQRAEWVAPNRLASYPVSAPQRQILNALTSPSRRKLV